VLLHLPYYYLQFDTIINVTPKTGQEYATIPICVRLLSLKTCDLKQEVAFIRKEGSNYSGTLLRIHIIYMKAIMLENTILHCSVN